MVIIPLALEPGVDHPDGFGNIRLGFLFGEGSRNQY
jgi:hypothetical protein